jgi:hypothetical protein
MPRCGRYVRAGAPHCDRHDPSTSGEGRVETSDDAHARFLELLNRGEYAGFFDDRLLEVMRQAAQAMSERGLTEEIGALRMVLSRLVKEEQDLSKLTASVTRVASVAVQAARTQRAINGDTARGLTSALTQILAELDEG